MYVLICVHVNFSACWSVPQSSGCLHRSGPAFRLLNGFDYSEELGSVHVCSVPQFLALREKRFIFYDLDGLRADRRFLGFFMRDTSYTGLRSFSGSAAVAAGIDTEWV